jgi:hypothetical protein
VEPPRFEPPRMEPPRMDPPRFEQSRMEPPRMEPSRMEQPWFKQPRMEPPRFEQPKMEPPRFEQPRMEPPRFEPRMEPPWMGQPQFGFPRAEPFQGQPEVGFKVEPLQRFGPIRDEPYTEQVRFEQPYEFRNEPYVPPRNEPYVPPQNRRNRPRNDYNGQNFPEEDVFNRGVNLEERNRDIEVEPNPRPIQGQDLRDQIFEVIDQALGPGHRRTPRHPYRKPYPERIDREEWPRGFKVPDFTMFSSEDDKTALEHISRFTVQCGEYSNNGNGKLRMFPNSLTGQAFTWYAALPTNSIGSWEEMEEIFQSHFARSNIGVSITDLARLKKKLDESAEQFIMRFKRIRTRCLTTLPKAEYIKIAIDGLNFELRKKF